MNEMTFEEKERRARQMGVEAAKKELKEGVRDGNPFEASAQNHDDISAGKLWQAWQDGYDDAIMRLTLF